MGADDELVEVYLRPLVWMGDARKNIQSFPDDVQRSVGYALQLVQAGETPIDAKSFKGVGSGVYEISKRYDTDTYRAVYAVKIGEKIYVLHAFQKKSKQGITANCNQTRHREKVNASIRDLFYDLPVAGLFSNCCKTPQSDIDLIKQRYRDAVAREEENDGRDNV